MLLRAEQEAAARNHPVTDVDHLLLALLLEGDEPARFLESAGVDTAYVRSQLDGALRVAALSSAEGAPRVAPQVQALIRRAGDDSLQVSGMDLLRAFLADQDQLTVSLLELVGLGDVQIQAPGLVQALGPAVPAPDRIELEADSRAQAS